MLYLISNLRRAGAAALFFVLPAVGIAVPAQAVEVQRVVSPGGIEAWLVQDSSIPLVSVEFLFRGGAAHDPKGKAGVANLTASLLDEGAGDLDSQAFQGRLQNLSIQLGFDAGYDSFGGSLKTLNRNRAEAVRLLRLALTEARFDTEAVERMRAETIAGIKRRSSRPGSVARKIWRRAVFPDHPYGRSVRGTERSVQGIEVADLKAFVKDRLAKDRLFVGVAGSITPDELKTLLDEAFGGLPASGAPDTLNEASLNGLGDTFVVQRPVPQSVAVFGMPGLSRQDPDYYAAYVMNHILGGGSFSSRFYEEVREKRGLAYSIYSYLQPRRAAPFWMGSVATANAGMAQSVELIRAQVRRMREAGVSEEELKNAKLFLNGSFPLRFTSSDRISSILAAMQFHGLGIDYLDRRPQYIEAVTTADIARLAKQLLDPEKLTFSVVGQPSGLKSTRDAPDIDS